MRQPRIADVLKVQVRVRPRHQQSPLMRIPRRGPNRTAEAWFAGKLFDDRGSRMSPSESPRAGRRWRYYVSQAILQGRKQEAGSMARLRAGDRGQGPRGSPRRARRCGMRRHRYQDGHRTGGDRTGGAPHPIERPDIAGRERSNDLRPMNPAAGPPPPRDCSGRESLAIKRSPEAYGGSSSLHWSCRRARLWLDRLIAQPEVSVASITLDERRTERSVRQTLSLAFLDPALVEAATEGRLPRGFGLKRLIDLPPEWSSNSRNARAPRNGIRPPQTWRAKPPLR
jgi:site-specific DNA recombinase